jgi:hypothetical protein
VLQEDTPEKRSQPESAQRIYCCRFPRTPILPHPLLNARAQDEVNSNRLNSQLSSGSVAVASILPHPHMKDVFSLHHSVNGVSDIRSMVPGYMITRAQDESVDISDMKSQYRIRKCQCERLSSFFGCCSVMQLRITRAFLIWNKHGASR